jgi:hypothetical protein
MMNDEFSLSSSFIIHHLSLTRPYLVFHSMFLKYRFGDLRLGGLFILAFIATSGFAQEQKLVSIIGVGDMMLGTNYPSKAYLPPDGGIGLCKAPM